MELPSDHDSVVIVAVVTGVANTEFSTLERRVCGNERHWGSEWLVKRSVHQPLSWNLS